MIRACDAAGFRHPQLVELREGGFGTFKASGCQGSDRVLVESLRQAASAYLRAVRRNLFLAPVARGGSITVPSYIISGTERHAESKEASEFGVL